jgi:hypothetical protein
MEERLRTLSSPRTRSFQTFGEQTIVTSVPTKGDRESFEQRPAVRPLVLGA